MRINKIIVLNLLLIILFGENALAKCPQKLYTCKGKIITTVANAEVDGIVSLFLDNDERPIESAQISKNGEYNIKFRFDSFRQMLFSYHDCRGMPERLTFIITSQKYNSILRKEFKFKNLVRTEANEIIIPEFILDGLVKSPK